MTDKLWTDLALTKKQLFLWVADENSYQLKKWGVQSRSPFEWLAYLTEETGEVAKAISDHFYRGGSLVDIEKEAVQVATLALKIAEMACAEEGD